MSTTCKTCCFYLDPGPGYDSVCRRYPPLPLMQTGRGMVGEYHQVKSSYPHVNDDDWCGEYKPAVTP